MSLEALLKSWQEEATISDNIVHWQTLPAHNAVVVPFPGTLHPLLQKVLQGMGIHSLFSHQAETWDHLSAGRHVALVTGTASGKTLAYNLPVLNHLIGDDNARALYLFPTKALAHDQLEKLQDIIGRLGSFGLTIPPVAAYDGDTPSSHRPHIRRNAHIILTNPDMLHTGILPRHTDWDEFFTGLRFVIIDEIHTYRGVFGSHVANVLRRLQRITTFYGAQPQYLLTSATIANPAELADRLIEKPITLVTNDGAPRGERHFLFYNPPITVPDLGLRASSLQESLRLADDLLTYNLQSVLFGRSRRTIELLVSYLRQRRPKQATAIRGYRSGYLPHERREIERGLREGKVRAVTATTALELGVDIGSLTAAVMVGYPGSISATWQQAGRAGRTDQPSLAVLVASASPLDQYLAHHPEYFFGRSPEQALINPYNPLIVLDHLQCAAFELPFQKEEGYGQMHPTEVTDLLTWLVEAGVLYLSGERYFWTSSEYPSGNVSLRTVSAKRVLLQTKDDSSKVTIGEIDRESAPWFVHPGAIYLHEGRMYLVEDLDLEQNLAYLQPIQSDYYTRPQRNTTVELIEQLNTRKVKGATIAHGDLKITSQVTGFRKIQWFTHANLGAEELDLPPTTLQTSGFWIGLSEEVLAQLREEGLWQGDQISYGPGWKHQRDLARARDEFKCRACGEPERDKAHHVHHLVPFRTFSTPKEANRLENLVTLCSACHLRAEGVVRIRSSLVGLAYTLEHLAPLLLMCDTSDLGVHTDITSPLTDGQPTVVIYEHVPAGLGFSERLFTQHEELIRAAHELVNTCPCNDGCPSCVGPGGEQGTGGKSETLSLLELLR
ncbi:MAG: DEAD/DEAH box helicase [Chloroflexota bacterium]